VKPPRRFLHLAAAAAALPGIFAILTALTGHGAWAQTTYPVRPLRLVVGFPPGGTTDIVARTIGQWLSGRFGQPVIIENKPGATTNIAVQAVLNSPPDGYTLYFASASNAVNATFYDGLPFNFLRDMTPVAGISRVPFFMEVHPSVPAKTVADFIAYAKANPGKINMASYGVGNTNHVAGELFKMVTGINMFHVPYRGEAPALTDLISGQVQVLFGAAPASLPHIQSGALRALAVTTIARLDALPDLPTVGETVPGFEVSTWYGVGAPAGTPAEVIEKLNGEINAGLADPNVKMRFADLLTTPMALSSAEYGRHVAAETEKWAKVVKFAGIKPE
jgi:tripartite-type tricarboxylate transporter receptor subunit TctC